MDFEGEDAIAHGADNDRRAAQQGRLDCGKAGDLLEQEGAQDAGQRQVVRLGLAEAGEHAAQDLRDLAG